MPSNSDDYYENNRRQVLIAGDRVKAIKDLIAWQQDTVDRLQLQAVAAMNKVDLLKSVLRYAEEELEGAQEFAGRSYNELDRKRKADAGDAHV